MARRSTRRRRQHGDHQVRLCKRCGIDFIIVLEEDSESQLCPGCLDDLIAEQEELGDEEDWETGEDGDWELPPYDLLEA